MIHLSERWPFLSVLTHLSLTCNPPFPCRLPVSLCLNTWRPPSTRTSPTWRRPPCSAARCCARGRAAASGRTTTPTTTCTWTPPTSASCGPTGGTWRSVSPLQPSSTTGPKTSPVSATQGRAVQPNWCIRAQSNWSGFNLWGEGRSDYRVINEIKTVGHQREWRIIILKC